MRSHMSTILVQKVEVPMQIADAVSWIRFWMVVLGDMPWWFMLGHMARSLCLENAECESGMAIARSCRGLRPRQGHES